MSKFVLFDWDGTLVDSFAFLEAAHDYVLNLFALPERSQNWFREYFGKPRDFIYLDIYGDRGEEARGHFESFVRDNHKTLLNPIAGAQDLLETLMENNITMAVVSNKRSEFIHVEVEHLGWSKYFVCVIGAGDAKEDKPSAEPIFEAIRQSQKDVQPSDVLYVGDTEVDLITAKNASCPCILINPNEKEPEWLSGYTPQKTVINCEELSNYLLQYYQK